MYTHPIRSRLPVPACHASAGPIDGTDEADLQSQVEDQRKQKSADDHRERDVAFRVDHLAAEVDDLADTGVGEDDTTAGHRPVPHRSEPTVADEVLRLERGEHQQE